MAYRAKSIASLDHPAQSKPQHKALKILKRSGLMKQLDELIAKTTPRIAQEMGVMPAQARRMAQRWILEGVCEYIYMSTGDVIFIENDHD